MGTNDDDLREHFGPGDEPAEEPPAEAPEPVDEPQPEPEPESVDPGPPTERVVVWEDADDEPVADELDEPEEEVVLREPNPWPSRIVALLALALIALFFVPWLDADGFFRSSGAGLVSWTDRFIVNLEEGVFEQQMLVPYLAVAIPVLALVVCALAIVGRQVRWLLITTGLVPPVLLVYALAREGGDVFRVLEAGAYLTVACSLALIAAGFGLLASRWGRVTLVGALALAIVAAFMIPAAVQDDVDSRLFTAYAANRTTLAPESTDTTDDDDEVALPTTTTSTTLLFTATTVLQATTSTAPTTTTRAAAPAVTSGCPSSGPSSTLEVFRFDQQAPDSDTYLVDVRGSTQNRTGASVNIVSIEVAVRRNGAEVGRLSVPANRTLASGQVLEWFRDDATITSPGSPPSGADVVSVPYTWTDARFANCATP